MKLGKCDKCHQETQLFKSFDKHFCKKCKREIKKVQITVMKKHPEITGRADLISDKVKEAYMKNETIQ